MEKMIIIPDKQFDFSGIRLNEPRSLYGGSYFTKITNNASSLYIQTPKCQTRQGFVTSAKKIYSDLIFSKDDNMEFIQWLLDLESKCSDLIYQNSSDWFQTPLEMSEIENAFNSSVKLNKTTGYLVRANVKIHSMTKDPVLRVYNKSETKLSISDVTSDMEILTILEISGIKFTTRSFQLELEMKQIMILDRDIFDNCLIKPLSNSRMDSVSSGPTLGQQMVSLSNSVEVAEEEGSDVRSDEREYLPPKLVESTDSNTNHAIALSFSSTQPEESTTSDDLAKDTMVRVEDAVEDAVEEEEEDDTDDDDNDDDESIEKLTFGDATTLTDVEDINAQPTDGDKNAKSSEEINIATIPLDETILESDLLAMNAKDLAKKSSVSIGNDKLVNSILENMNSQALAIETETASKIGDELEDVSMEELEPTDESSLSLNPPNNHYYNLFQVARDKAKEVKREVTSDYLSTKNIKKGDMLEDMSDTSDESSHNLIDAELEEL